MLVHNNSSNHSPVSVLQKLDFDDTSCFSNASSSSDRSTMNASKGLSSCGDLAASTTADSDRVTAAKENHVEKKKKHQHRHHQSKKDKKHKDKKELDRQEDASEKEEKKAKKKHKHHKSDKDGNKSKDTDSVEAKVVEKSEGTKGKKTKDKDEKKKQQQQQEQQQEQEQQQRRDISDKQKKDRRQRRKRSDTSLCYSIKEEEEEELPTTADESCSDGSEQGGEDCIADPVFHDDHDDPAAGTDRSRRHRHPSAGQERDEDHTTTSVSIHIPSFEEFLNSLDNTTCHTTTTRSAVDDSTMEQLIEDTTESTLGDGVITEANRVPPGTKKVRFPSKPHKVVDYVQKRSGMTPSERHDVWYCEEDFRQMKHDDIDVCNFLLSEGKKLPSNMSDRGVDSDDIAWAKFEARRNAVNAVLDEQDRCRGYSHEYVRKAVAAVYMKHSIPATKDAVERARTDETQSMKVLKTITPPKLWRKLKHKRRMSIRSNKQQMKEILEELQSLYPPTSN